MPADTRERQQPNHASPPVVPPIGARTTYALQRLLRPNPAWRSLARWLERHRRPYRAFTAAEATVKSSLFGCKMCGQCALPATGYACPMTCPKEMRNGPCGGVRADGTCEVFPGVQCVWVAAFERCERSGRVGDLDLLHHPIDQRSRGQSSWVNYWQGRDDDLWGPP
ncbi:methylenetetrahydrofolate reductase C-terminal domain-containing protein [Desertimonas flava]|uniref:methylenetetrahydrofolate reductase C-terminal domain-containing protein n=1 Tax=Desertimonas flava TaxID=2064846 RepID=UPI000E34F4CB|nr:methylenetetrahydrofolate reductase C-terminal domain-containing protein [Desertimonas flava]